VRCLANVFKASKEILVEDLFAEPAVEAFDEGVLVWFVGQDVLD